MYVKNESEKSVSTQTHNRVVKDVADQSVYIIDAR